MKLVDISKIEGKTCMTKLDNGKDTLVVRVSDINSLTVLTVDDIIPHSYWTEHPARNSDSAIDKCFQCKRVWDKTIKKSDLDRYGWNANPWVWVIEFERISKEEAYGT